MLADREGRLCAFSVIWCTPPLTPPSLAVMPVRGVLSYPPRVATFCACTARAVRPGRQPPLLCMRTRTRAFSLARLLLPPSCIRAYVHVHRPACRQVYRHRRRHLCPHVFRHVCRHADRRPCVQICLGGGLCRSPGIIVGARLAGAAVLGRIPATRRPLPPLYTENTASFSMPACWIALVAHASHRQQPQPDLIPDGLPDLI